MSVTSNQQLKSLLCSSKTGVFINHIWLLVMGLTKQYLRYVTSAVFGVIGSQKANIAYVNLRGGEKGRYIAVAACEHVFIWDVRKGEKVRFSGFWLHRNLPKI